MRWYYGEQEESWIYNPNYQMDALRERENHYVVG